MRTAEHVINEPLGEHATPTALQTRNGRQP
jgi:hypothetical protein